MTNVSLRTALLTRGGLTCLAWAVVALAAGCRGDEHLSDAYGSRTGEAGFQSVNGTSVLAGMFAEAGFKVSSWRKLSPRLEQAQVIVWVPDDYAAPPAVAQGWLENWLARGNWRTLVVVGRDYDAAPDYWNKVLPRVPPERAAEAKGRAAAAASWTALQRLKFPKLQETRWFTLRDDQPGQTVSEVEGEWLGEGEMLGEVEIPVRGRLQPPANAAVDELLSGGGEVVAYRLTDQAYGNGQIIVVQNGSFLLNYSLVNHAHRVLAGKLIAECEPAGNVVFLESGTGGPQILAEDPQTEPQTWFAMLSVWPLCVVMLQFAALGTVYLLSRFPIFGRPRELPAEATSDFGKHLAALGRLLAKTRDRAYAAARLAHYHQTARRESGATHAASASGSPRRSS